MNQRLREERIKSLSIEISNIREMNGKGCQLPIKIWEEISTLCEGERLSQIADQLKVSRSQLWKKVKQADGEGINSQSNREVESQEPKIDFLEFKMIQPSSAEAAPTSASLLRSAEIELENRNGVRLKILNLQAHGVSLLDLVRSFGRCEG